MKRFTYRILFTLTFVFSYKLEAEPKNYGAAIANLEAQLKTRPNNVKIHFKLGQAYYYTKAWDQAIVHFKKSNNPTNVESLEWIAKTSEQTHNHLEVIRALELI